MMTNKEINKTARIAGFLYLIMFPLGMFPLFFGPDSVIVPGDAGATANNIMASESLFRLSFMTDLISQVIFIFLVLVLYKLLKPVEKNLASLMVILALVGVPITMLNLLHELAPVLLLSAAAYLTAFEAGQLHALVMLFLDLYEIGFYIAMIFWGIWLLPLGYLVFKSGYLPKILGVLLIIGGLGYLIDVVTFFLFPNIDASMLKYFTFWGEVLFPLWLLIKGVNVEQWGKRAIESA